jgi:hypothetical protein
MGCSEVSIRTIIHNIKEPWAWAPSAEHYYFCKNPECEVAYFGSDHSVVLKVQLRSSLMASEVGQWNLLCYCFGVSRHDLRQNPNIKDFIIAQTKSGACSCETRNPSGRCCLAEFKIAPPQETNAK